MAKNRLQDSKWMCGALESHCELVGIWCWIFPLMPVDFYFSYNITTGLYPFEGDNIYRLLENIGKGVWTVPEGLDPLLTDLLLNMLRFDPNERFTIQNIRDHLWYISSPVNTGDAVPVPPLKGDSLRSSTVLPYLESYHYENRQNQNVFFTEHDLNGK
jgi:serine/threonine-protein kinase 11